MKNYELCFFEKVYKRGGRLWIFYFFFLFLVILMLLFLFYDLKVVSCYFFLLLQVIYIGIYFLRGENGDTMNLYIYTEDCPLHRR